MTHMGLSCRLFLKYLNGQMITVTIFLYKWLKYDFQHSEMGNLFFDIFEIDLVHQPFRPRHRTTIFQTPVLIPYNKHKIGVC